MKEKTVKGLKGFDKQINKTISVYIHLCMCMLCMFHKNKTICAEETDIFDLNFVIFLFRHVINKVTHF